MDQPRIAVRPWVLDLATVSVVAALMVGGAVVAADDPGQTALTLGGATLLVGSAVALWWRRSLPTAAALVSGLCSATYGIAELPDPAFPVAAVVAFYSVARWCTRRWTLAAAGVVAVVTVAGLVLPGDSGADDYYRNLLPAVVALVLGDQVRERARAEDQRRRSDLDAAVTGERRRIARELHDVVAHHVTMVVVQAEAGGAAEDAAGDDVAAARFDEISTSARGALGELRLLLDVLRDGDEGAGTSPSPGLADVADLVERVRHAGVPVTLAVTGDAAPLDPVADLSAYRIVQEALTNVVRHAGPVPTRVEIDHQPEGVTLVVADDGPAVGVGTTPGRGLLGIGERVGLLGGTSHLGPRPEGGFEVRVTLPRTHPAPSSEAAP